MNSHRDHVYMIGLGDDLIFTRNRGNRESIKVVSKGRELNFVRVLDDRQRRRPDDHQSGHVGRLSISNVVGVLDDYIHEPENELSSLRFLSLHLFLILLRPIFSRSQNLLQDKRLFENAVAFRWRFQWLEGFCNKSKSS